MYINYDIKLGIFLQWKKYIIVVLLFLFFCINLYSRSAFYSSIISKENMPTFVDYFMFIFRGVEPFNPQIGNYFKLPLMWVLYNLTIAYIVGDYPTKELNHYGNNVLTRIRSRKKWWISKCLWNMMNVVLFYIIGYITILAFNLFTVHEISFIPNQMINLFMTSNDVIKINFEGSQFIFAVFFLPIIVSISLSLLQMTLSFILNPILSFIIIIGLLVSSIYLDSHIFISNGSMLVRNLLFSNKGTNNMTTVIIAILVSIVSIIIGLFCFNRYDVLRKI